MGSRELRVLLLLLGASQVALGLLMALDPSYFFDLIGPYGTRNDHYIRDTSTFYLALGAVLLLAARRPGWRVPVLAFALIQYVLHAANHLKDVGKADPGWLGPANAISLVLTAALLGWVLLGAVREQRRS